MGRRSRPADQPGPFDFLGWRRRVISDRTWLGLGLVAMGTGVPLDEGGWAWLFALAVPVGVAFVVSGFRRAVARAVLEERDWPVPPL